VSDPVRWGLLSTARINDRLLEAARASDLAEIVAVASRDAARARAYADENAIAGAHEGYEALLADPDVEAVYVSAPNALHVPWSIRALEAGKHVLCEKPLTASAAEAEEAFAAAERAGRLLVEGFMWRHHPQTDLLARLVSDGAVGAPRLVRATFSFTLARPGDVRLAAGLEGGAVMDVGCYCVSALRLLCGEPERVSGEAVRGGDGVDVRFSGVLRFPGDVLGGFDCGFDLPRLAGIEVVGEEGMLTVEDPWQARSPLLLLAREGEPPEAIGAEAADPYLLELDDVSRAIREGGEPRLGRTDALGQARTLEALYRAAGEGRAVALA
jgi:predicted dehydrogenase